MFYLHEDRDRWKSAGPAALTPLHSERAYQTDTGLRARTTSAGLIAVIYSEAWRLLGREKETRL